MMTYEVIDSIVVFRVDGALYVSKREVEKHGLDACQEAVEKACTQTYDIKVYTEDPVCPKCGQRRAVNACGMPLIFYIHHAKSKVPDLRPLTGWADVPAGRSPIQDGDYWAPVDDVRHPLRPEVLEMGCRRCGYSWLMSPAMR